jgi:hypothetical protein
MHMAKNVEQPADLSTLALSLARETSTVEDLTAALRDNLAPAVPEVGDEICMAVLGWVAHAAMTLTAKPTPLSEAELREAATTATAFMAFRRWGPV